MPVVLDVDPDLVSGPEIRIGREHLVVFLRHPSVLYGAGLSDAAQEFRFTLQILQKLHVDSVGVGIGVLPAVSLFVVDAGVLPVVLVLAVVIVDVGDISVFFDRPDIFLPGYLHQFLVREGLLSVLGADEPGHVPVYESRVVVDPGGGVVSRYYEVPQEDERRNACQDEYQRRQREEDGTRLPREPGYVGGQALLSGPAL